MVIQSTREGNSIYDEMKSRVFELHMLERQTAYESNMADDELAKALEISEDDFNFSLFKLDELASLAHNSEDIKRKFISQKLYIENSSISSKNKIEVILTTACILTRIHKQIKNLTEQELFLLGQIMVNVPLEHYPTYGEVLGNSDILESVYIVTKSNSGLEITESTFDYCDECQSCELSDSIYQHVIKALLPVIRKQYEKTKQYIKN